MSVQYTYCYHSGTMASDKYYDYIVVGCGGVGSSALYRLAKSTRGETVLGIEQFEIGHHRGGSQDVSRIIRLSYTQPHHVSLAAGAYDAWAEVEEDSGIQLVHKCGGLDVAELDTEGERILRGMARSMDANGVKYETLDGYQLSRKFPSFTPKANIVAMYQKDGGLVDAALSNAVHVQLARKYGAETLDNTTVKKISRDQDGRLRVSTSRGDFRCKKIVIAAGAWINDVTSHVGVHVPVTVTQEQVTYFATPHMKEFSYKRFPYILFHCPGGYVSGYYTLPIYSNSGFKMGIDLGGPPVTADTRNFRPDPVREKTSADFLRSTLPRSVGPVLYTKTCLYTMTGDREFVVDTAHRTGFPDVIICCGAGHVFKFASVMGKILTNLALDKHVPFDLSKYTLDRPAILDPNFNKQLVLKPADNATVSKL